MNKPPSNPLSVDIAAELERDIKQGRFVPGQPLDERELAKRFGVSRTPVRAAVQQLSARGLIRVLPRQGLQVARVSISDLRDMFELLAELESTCAKLAAKRMDEPWRSMLIDACRRCEEAAADSDVAAYTRANVDFHGALYEACRNRCLSDQIREIRARTALYAVSVFQLPGRMKQSAREHNQVMAAVLEGAWLDAQRGMLEHVSIGGAGFTEFISLLPPGLLDGSDATTGAAIPAARMGQGPAADVTPHGRSAVRPLGD